MQIYAMHQQLLQKCKKNMKTHKMRPKMKNNMFSGVFVHKLEWLKSKKKKLDQLSLHLKYVRIGPIFSKKKSIQI